MKFLQMLPGQKLILAKVETHQPPTRPIVAQSTHRAKRESLLVIMILWAIRMIAPTVCKVFGTIRTNRIILTVLGAILITVILENLAAGYIQKMVGV